MRELLDSSQTSQPSPITWSWVAPTEVKEPSQYFRNWRCRSALSCPWNCKSWLAVSAVIGAWTIPEAMPRHDRTSDLRDEILEEASSMHL